jgi:hypothetical protein
VRQIDHDADAVHLLNDFTAIARETAVAFVAAGADEVLRVVAKLDHVYAEVLESLDIAQVVLERMGVLEAENDAGPVFFLRAEDVVRGTHKRQDLAVFTDLLLHLGDVVDGLLEAFPHRHRAVDRGDAALAHVFEDRTLELRNVQTVDDDAVVMQCAHRSLQTCQLTCLISGKALAQPYRASPVISSKNRFGFYS